MLENGALPAYTTRDMIPLDPDHSALLAALYQGLDGPRPWDAFLERLADWLGASFATLIITAPGMDTPGTFITPGADPVTAQAYLASYFTADPFRGLPEGQVMSFREFVQGLASRDLDHYRTFLDAVGGDQVLGVDLSPGRQFEARVRLTRDRLLPNFAREHRDALQSLVPHLRIALQLYEQLQRAGAERGAWRGAIDGMGVATVIVDGDGLIVDANAAADALLKTADGVRRNRGRLWFDEARHRAALTALLAEPDPRAGPIRLKVERRDLPALAIVARPMPVPALGSGKGAVALFMAVTGDEPRIEAQAIRALYGLTPAEARLAAELSGGRSLPEAAVRLAITHNTARVHLRAIFAKTGARRQAHLVSLLRIAVS